MKVAKCLSLPDAHNKMALNALLISLLAECIDDAVI